MNVGNPAFRSPTAAADTEERPSERHFDGHTGAPSACDVCPACESVERVDAMGEYPVGAGSGLDAAPKPRCPGRRVARREPSAVPQTFQ